MKVSIREFGDISVVDLSGKTTIGEGDVVLRERVHELLDGGKKKRHQNPDDRNDYQ